MEFGAALLQYRNTPDRDTGLSPAQVLFARKLRDAVPCNLRDLQLRPEWVLTREARERALARRHQTKEKEWSAHTKVLEELEVGTTVQVQNQTGPHARKWDLSGVVLESLGHDSYLVKMDGSGRITKRNRKFLRAIRPYKDILRDLGKGLGSRGGSPAVLHNSANIVTVPNVGLPSG